LAVVGEVIYFYVYDLGGHLDLASVERKLSTTTGDLRRELKVPSYLSITPKPLSYRLSKSEVVTCGVPRQMRIEARMHSVGALSVIFRIQFEGEMQDLINCSSPDEIHLVWEGELMDLRRLSRKIADQISEKLTGSLSSRYEREEKPEEYAVFCIANLQQGVDAAEFLQRNRKVFTAILREIRDVERVSENDCELALRYTVSYASDYLVAVDWASSAVIQTSNDYEDYLLTIELANVQLLQLRTFDGLIDKLISKAYSDTRYLSNPPWPSILFARGLSETVAEIAEMRTEMIDVFDKVMNISKLFGDYTLARLYEHLSVRLHLQKWKDTVSNKLDILEDIYQMASDRVAGRQMLILEALIVLLFVFEVAVTIFRFFK